MIHIAPPRRLYSIIIIVLVLITTASLTLHNLGYSYWPSWRDAANSKACSITTPASLDEGITTRPVKIAILESIGTHDEVAMAIVHSFGGQKNAEVYPFFKHQRYDMPKIMEKFSLEAQFDEVKNVYAFTQLARECPPPDIVVSVTCELDLRNAWVTASIKHLLSNDVTQLFCLFHHADQWNAGGHVDVAREWNDKERVEFLGLSEHTVDFFKNVTKKHWDSNVTARVLPPVFPVEHSDLDKKSGFALAMQGDYSAKRRDYQGIFGKLGDVVKMAKESPKEYKDREVKLHLIGHGGRPEVPKELNASVVFDEGVSYPDFYELLSQSFAVIPAFASEEYLDRKASSSIPASLIAGAPVVASEELLKSYSYLNRDAVWLSKEDENEMETVERVMSDWDEYLKKRELTARTTTELMAKNRENVKTWINGVLAKGYLAMEESD